MSLDQTPPKSFEDSLEAYSNSTKESTKSSRGLTSTTGYFAGAAAVLAMGNTEAEAAVYVVPVNHVMNPASGGGIAEFALDIDTSHLPGGREFGDALSDFGFQAMLDDPNQGGRDFFRMGGVDGH